MHARELFFLSISISSGIELDVLRLLVGTLAVKPQGDHFHMKRQIRTIKKIDILKIIIILTVTSRIREVDQVRLQKPTKYVSLNSDTKQTYKSRDKIRFRINVDNKRSLELI